MARVLVVEDSPSMRAYVRAALEEGRPNGVEGFDGPIEVVEAQNGFEALRLLPRGKFHAVVTDINMPDINGLEVVRYVRSSEHLRNVPVVVISTQASERDRSRALALGADVYLPKPFSPDSLCRALTESLTTRGQSSTGAGGAKAPQGSADEAPDTPRGAGELPGAR